MNAASQIATKEIVSQRGFCRRYYAIISPSRTYDTDAETGARGKMAGILDADRTVEGVIAAMVNFPWMIDGAKASKIWQRQARQVLDLLDRVEVDYSIPMKGWR